MLLERTLFQLDVGQVPNDLAEQMGHLGYAQWLGALKGNASYISKAEEAYAMASPFIDNSPAVAVFCGLIEESLAAPSRPVELKLPAAARRGGAKARRGLL